MLFIIRYTFEYAEVGLVLPVSTWQLHLGADAGYPQRLVWSVRVTNREPGNIWLIMASKYVRILCAAQLYCPLQHFTLVQGIIT